MGRIRSCAVAKLERLMPMMLMAVRPLKQQQSRSSTMLIPIRPSGLLLSSSTATAAATAEPLTKKARQRLHEERAALARAARQERQRKHEELRRQAQERRERHEQKQIKAGKQAEERRRMHAQAQQEAADRKHEAKRKTSIQSIPYWLRNNPKSYDLTMDALNVKAVKTAKDGIGAEYKQIYLHSIPSFCEHLEQDHEQMKEALDALVDAGFHDAKWAKSYRQRVGNQVHLDRLQSRIVSGRVQRDKQQAKVKTLQARLERLVEKETVRDEHERIEKEKEQVQEQPDPGMIGRALNVVSTLISGNEPNVAEPPSAHVKSKSIRIRRQETATREAEKQLGRCKRNLKLLEDERDAYSFSMSQEEYDEANQVVESVLGDICKALASHIHERHSGMIDQYRTLDSKTDLTKPHEWYMHARLDRRKIIFHAGPTNSGKTYTALERLKTAERGLYLGPLRLLAAEVYETLTSQGVYTNLFTGQEKREIPFATHAAATVELASTTDEFDVVVIDEIQMIADPFRGFAWTKALLGTRCKEIHVCGGLEARDIVERIAEFCGDELETITYERFSPLHVEKESLASKPKQLGSYKNVQPGDCVVAFSRNDIFAIKREIEGGTNFKCCVIYGSLPPETRTDQARRFNDPNSGYDILVASDAIGMGLNLNIRRIIFNSLYKFRGENIAQLDHSSVKQISGRAGRRNSRFPEGYVTCRDPEDMEHLRKCMSTEIRPIEKAGLLPTGAHVELFNDALKKYELGNDYDNLYKILVQFSEMATLKGDFFLCRQTPMQTVAKILDDVDIPLAEKFLLCMSPVSTNCSRGMNTLKQFAIKQSKGQASGVPHARPRPAGSMDDLSHLCSIHSQLELFLWLNNKFPGTNVMEQQTALALKERTIALINKGLAESERLQLRHCYIKRDAAIRADWKGRMKSKVNKLDDDDYLENSEVDEI